MGTVPNRPESRLAYAVGVESALHYPEVGGPGVAAGNPLDGYAVADGFDGSHKSDHGEGRQKRPKLHARGELEPRPRTEGNADPGRVQHCLNIVHPEGRGHGATKYDPNQRRPQSQRRRPPEHQRRDDHDGDQRRNRGSRRSSAFGRIIQRVEHDGHNCGRYQHNHCAGDHWGEYPAQQREARGHKELKQRRQYDEAGHQGRGRLVPGRLRRPR